MHASFHSGLQAAPGALAFHGYEHPFDVVFKFQRVCNSSVDDDSHLFWSVSEITNVPW
jgi:hypothetical protein